MGKEAVTEKSCNTCVSRLICPTNYRPCMGHNSEELFWSFLKMPFIGEEARIDGYRALVEKLQRESEEAWRRECE